MSQTLQKFQNNSLNKTQGNRFLMISSARAHINKFSAIHVHAIAKL